MSIKPEPDFILRAAGLFLCEWPEGISGERLIDLLEKEDSDNADLGIVFWQPFQDCDNDTMVEHIESHAQALRRHWQEDFDAGMKYVATEVAVYLVQRTNHPLFDPECDAMDIIESAHKQLTSYID